jgi:hypothetical protein
MNRFLEPLNLRLDTLTAKRTKSWRISRLERAGHFDRPVLPVLPQFTSCNPKPILEAVERFADKTRRFCRPAKPGSYSFDNDYYTSPDAEVLYAMVHLLRPGHVVEVGSGHSTRLFQEAIADAQTGRD